MTAELRHVWTPDGTTLCLTGRSDEEIKLIRPTPAPSGTAQTCPGCVIAVEIYISVVKGTIIASAPPAATPAEAVDSLRRSKWAETVDLDLLSSEIADGRSLKIYNPEEWVHR